MVDTSAAMAFATAGVAPFPAARDLSERIDPFIPLWRW
jgi:hypothetical protein